jgi:hypothetical protein
MAAIGSRTHEIMTEVLKEELDYVQGKSAKGRSGLFYPTAFGYMRTYTVEQKAILEDSRRMCSELNAQRQKSAADRLAHYVRTGELLKVDHPFLH